MSIAASEGELELLERTIRLRCCSGGSNAGVWSGSDGYAFPGRRKGRARVEKATMSRTLEVGWLVSRGSLCWFSVPCPGCLSPGRAWGAYRSWTAPFTARNRPANSSSLTTLGGAARGYGVPPVERSVAIASVSLYCLHPLFYPVRELRYYVERTQSFRTSDQLFVCHGGRQKGNAVSKQRMAHWIVDAITLAYQAQGVPYPFRLRAHSTRSVASSSLTDICRAAGWATPNTFDRFYSLRVEPVSSCVLTLNG